MTAPDKIKHGSIVKRASFRIEIAEIFAAGRRNRVECYEGYERKHRVSIVGTRLRQSWGYDNDINENER